MTIKEFAKGQGITTQAVYQRIKAAGIDLAGIKKENTAELSAEGLEVLNNLFAKNDGQAAQKAAELKKQVDRQQIEIEKLKEELERQKTAAEDWRKQALRWADTAEAAQKAAQQAQKIAEKIQAALQVEQQTAQQAQALQMASIQALKRPPRLSFWQRLTGKRAEVLETTAAAAEESKTE
jgi:chromosome condensin MukBEF ATPase and DNA-binding subunit MukB